MPQQFAGLLRRLRRAACAPQAGPPPARHTREEGGLWRGARGVCVAEKGRDSTQRALQERQRVGVVVSRQAHAWERGDGEGLRGAHEAAGSHERGVVTGVQEVEEVR